MRRRGSALDDVDVEVKASSANAVYQVAGSYANVGNGWKPDIRPEFLRELKGGYGSAGFAVRVLTFALAFIARLWLL